jgi:hypothetical protein
MTKQLPPRPNLEQLKKQSKDLRQAQRSASPEAATRIGEYLPRLADSSEQEILAADISLQEAQHVIAGEYGFKNWNWLQAVVEIDFNLLAKLTDREIQILMRMVDQKDLVLSLKSTSDELKEKVLGNMSERVREFIVEEMEFLGSVPSSEIEETQQRVLRQTAALAVEGWIDWPNGDRSKQEVLTNASWEKTPKPAAYQPAPELISLYATPLDQLTTQEIAAMWQGLAVQARDVGILSLERTAQRIESRFAQEALNLAADGTEPRPDSRHLGDTSGPGYSTWTEKTVPDDDRGAGGDPVRRQSRHYPLQAECFLPVRAGRIWRPSQQEDPGRRTGGTAAGAALRADGTRSDHGTVYRHGSPGAARGRRRLHPADRSGRLPAPAAGAGDDSRRGLYRAVYRLE